MTSLLHSQEPGGILPEVDAAEEVNPAPPSKAPSGPAPLASSSTAGRPLPNPPPPGPPLDENWVETLPVAQAVPFSLSVAAVSRDISRDWWSSDRLGLRFARNPSPMESSSNAIDWRSLPSGECGAVLRGTIRLQRAEIRILQAVVIYRFASSWAVASSPMSVRYVGNDGKTAELVVPADQKGRWQASVDNRGLLVAGWTATALNAARERIGDYVRDEELRRTLQTCGEAVFKIAPK